MQKFNDYKYERPDLDAVRETISALTDAMHNARTPDEAVTVIRKERRLYQTPCDLGYAC